MKRKFAIGIVSLITVIWLVSAVNGWMNDAEPENSPWVYPTTQANPTTTEYYQTPIAEGPNTIQLVIWNHDQNYDFVNGKFIIAIKTGLSQVTIDSVSLTFGTEDLTGTTHPGDFPPGDIFPCPWKQYDIGTTLTDWASPDGWQGLGDPSGINLTITMTVTGNPLNVKLYFLAWGYKDAPQGLKYTDTPYSHVTETSSRPPNEVPEVPMGPVVATASMIAAFGAYFGIRKRRTPRP